MNEKELSFGEKAVGLTFNPSNDGNVQRVKEKFAIVIDEINNFRIGVISMKSDTHEQEVANKEIVRMLSIAITEAQTAQMWAVKAVTFRN